MHVAPNQIERLPTVMARTGCRRSAIYAGIKCGTFPKPIKLSARAIGFVSVEIDEWIVERIAARNEAAGKFSHK